MNLCSVNLPIAGFLICGIFWIKVLADEVTVISINRDVPAERLTCYTCRHSRSSPNNECINMLNTTKIAKVTCKLSQPLCRVRKLTNDDHVELLERSCAETCYPGCEKKINRMQACATCCGHRLCNIGSGAADSRPQMTAPAVLASVAVIAALIGT